MEFKNKEVERLCKAAVEFRDSIEGLQDKFMNRYNGDHHWKAAINTFPNMQKSINQVLLAAGQAIPEDRKLLYLTAGRKEKDLGVAASVVRPPKGGVQMETRGCADCPGGVQVQPKGKALRVVNTVPQSEPTPIEKSRSKIEVEEPIIAPPIDPPVDSDVEPKLTTVEEVLESFTDDLEMMKAYCDKHGIKYHHANGAKKIAQKILEAQA